MIDFTQGQLFPRFLTNDRNGYAISKALEAGIRYALGVIKTGMDTLKDVEHMPEWRLDEMAWELGCLYDYSADIEAKRHWIRNAETLFAVHGTPQAIYNYIEGCFDSVRVEECWQYGGEPYHFRIEISGEMDGERAAWVYKAAQHAKNLRSVMDGISMGSTGTIRLTGNAGVVAYAPLVYCGEYAAGEWPEN